MNTLQEGNAVHSTENREILKHRALSLASIISRHFFEGEPSMAVQACNKLVDMGSVITQSGLLASEIGMPWSRLIKGAAQCEAGRRNGTVIPCLPDVPLPTNLAYAVLHAMMTFPSDNSDEIYEALSNALVRRSVFVTGAVTMDGCPPADRGEVVFIGRYGYTLTFFYIPEDHDIKQFYMIIVGVMWENPVWLIWCVSQRYTCLCILYNV